MEEIKKVCGNCVYPSFKPSMVNGCLAPMPIGDKRRNREIEPDTPCFVESQFTFKRDKK